MVGTDTGVDIQFAVLGPLEVTRDGRSADLGGPKPRTLLAMLLLSPGQPVGVEALIDALWGEEAPATSVKTIHKYVSYLRKQLGEAIVTRPGGYSLEVARDDIDVGRFEHMLERAGVAASEEEIVASLGDALSLWRGEAFSELPRSDFAVAERARLEERRLSATEELIQAELALGRHVAVVSRL